jgi:hypothetical protein
MAVAAPVNISMLLRIDPATGNLSPCSMDSMGGGAGAAALGPLVIAVINVPGDGGVSASAVISVILASAAIPLPWTRYVADFTALRQSAPGVRIVCNTF